MTLMVERYVIALSIIVLGTSVIFVWAGETRLGLCTTVYIVEVLAINQVAVHMSSMVKKRLVTVDRVLMVCFVFIALVELTRILAPLV